MMKHWQKISYWSQLKYQYLEPEVSRYWLERWFIFLFVFRSSVNCAWHLFCMLWVITHKYMLTENKFHKILSIIYTQLQRNTQRSTLKNIEVLQTIICNFSLHFIEWVLVSYSLSVNRLLIACSNRSVSALVVNEVNSWRSILRSYCRWGGNVWLIYWLVNYICCWGNNHWLNNLNWSWVL
jgi:hypothetical protein